MVTHTHTIRTRAFGVSSTRQDRLKNNIRDDTVTCKHCKGEHCKGEHWNRASHLPTPSIPLKVKLADGTIVDSVRPRYVSSYTVDPEFKDADGEPIKVVAWQYK